MLSAFILLFKIVLTFIILGIKMSIFKNLIFLPLDLITICSCLSGFPRWLELIYFHLLIANEISLTFLCETLQRILLTVLIRSHLYGRYMLSEAWAKAAENSPGDAEAQLHPEEMESPGIPPSELHLVHCVLLTVGFTAVSFTPF